MAASLADFFAHYGLAVLYLWLLVGIFIVPIPEEVVMLTVGILISQGDFSDWAYLVACAGSLSGVTLSYFLGHFLGRVLIVKYGKWIGISEKHLGKVESFFARYGQWGVSVGYFVPGTRHLMGVMAGTTHFGIKRYALFAYPGGILWVVLSITLGYLAGDYWLEIFHLAAKYFYYFVVIFIIIFVVGFLVYRYGYDKSSSGE
ncbi:MAG: DedA family protein [Chlamydiales bacterium]|nr:DedA family protein [Chlamydiales bacterium]